MAASRHGAGCFVHRWFFDHNPSIQSVPRKNNAATIRRMPDPRFGCQTATPRTLRVNGLDLSFLEWGPSGAPALCFLHGGAAHAHWFDAVLPPFVPGHHVVSLDQRGHGRSAWAVPPAYATEDFASDLLAIMDRLGWERTVLVGHSMGGHNAMAFSAWHPDR